MEWKKRYEDIWTREQAALARLEEIDQSKGYERMMISRLEQKVDILLSENEQLKTQFKKRNDAYGQLKRKTKEEDLLNRQIQERLNAVEASNGVLLQRLESAISLNDSLKKVNQSLIGDLKELRVLKNQQDMLIFTQHTMLDDVKKKLESI